MVTISRNVKDICRGCLKAYCRAIIKRWEPDGNYAAKVELIDRGFGNSTKLLLSVSQGADVGVPLARFFLRVYDTQKPADREKEIAGQLTKSMGSAYSQHFFDLSENELAVCRDHEPLFVVVYRWTDDSRNDNAMMSLSDWLQATTNPVDSMIKIFVQKITEAFDACAAALGHSQFGPRRLSRNRNDFSHRIFNEPPDYWLAGRGQSVAQREGIEIQFGFACLEEAKQQAQEIELSPTLDETFDQLQSEAGKPVAIHGEVFESLSLNGGRVLSVLSGRTVLFVESDIKLKVDPKGSEITLFLDSFYRLVPYPRKLVEAGYLIESFGPWQDPNSFLRQIDKEEEFTHVLRHRDFHEGNLCCGIDSIVAIDLADAGDGLYFEDLARLELSLWLAVSSDLVDAQMENLESVFADPEGSVNAHKLFGRVASAVAAIRRFVSERANEKSIGEREIAFTYWYVAFLNLRYVCLSENNRGFKRVFQFWISYWWERFNSLETPVESLTNTIIEHARRVTSELWESPKQHCLAMSFDDRINDRDRLDCFVWPELQWEVRGRNFEEVSPERVQWVVTAVEGDRQEEQMLNAVDSVMGSGNWLALTEGGGAGKSILSRKLAALLSEQAEPMLVFFWDEGLPDPAANSLWDLVKSDPRLKAVAEELGTEPGDVFEYAVRHQRIAVIVDGFDELSPEDQQCVERLLDKNCKSTFEATWVVTGRRYAFEEAFLKSSTSAHEFKLLRITPFSSEIQDEYFSNIVGLDNLAGGWRSILQDLGDDYQRELLSLPYTLRQIRFVLEKSLSESGNGPLPKYVSLSHLFIDTSKAMLMHQQRKYQTPEQRSEANQLFGTDDVALEVLAKVLATMAFEMMVQGHVRRVKAQPGHSTADAIRSIHDGALARFCASEPVNGLDRWVWSLKVLKKIAFRFQGVHEGFSSRLLAFQHRIVHEMHCARYLVAFATEQDYHELGKYVGHRDWDMVWKSAIQMPILREGRGVKPDCYNSALSCLFSPPIAVAGTELPRRPTYLMYLSIAWLNASASWVDTLIKLGEFQPDERESLKGVFKSVRASLLEQLAQELETFATGDGDQAGLAQELLSQDSYREFEPKSSGEVRRFWFLRQPVTNGQFQLFDSTHQYRDRLCENSNAPAIYCSWYDAAIFSMFVGGANWDGLQVTMSIPQPVEWAIAKGHSGFELGKGDRNLFCNVDTEVSALDEFDADNAGLKGMFSSGFEWCLKIDDEHPWPNPYYVVPGLRSPETEYLNVMFRLVAHVK